MRFRALINLLAAWSLVACSRDVATGRRAPDHPSTPSAGAFSSDTSIQGAAGSTLIGTGGNGGLVEGNDTLTVRVEDIKQLTIEVLTVACRGDCADVEAVAHGGNPPYSYVWEDGSSDAKRHVCLVANGTLKVNATDTAIKVPEFDYQAHTATDEISTIVLGCGPDAGVPTSNSMFCLNNPSLEGTPGLGEQGLKLPGWSICSVTPDVNPSVTAFAPSDGSTYLGVIGATTDIAESAGAAFCLPLQAAAPIHFSVDLAVSSFLGSPAQLQLWGGTTSCDKGELLWTSPTITDVDKWHTFCGTLTPSHSDSYLMVWPAPMAAVGGSYVLIDNFKATDHCD
jgi:hypothetical protein